MKVERLRADTLLAPHRYCVQGPCGLGRTATSCQDMEKALQRLERDTDTRVAQKLKTSTLRSF